MGRGAQRTHLGVVQGDLPEERMPQLTPEGWAGVSQTRRWASAGGKQVCSQQMEEHVRRDRKHK